MRTNIQLGPAQQIAGTDYGMLGSGERDREPARAYLCISLRLQSQRVSNSFKSAPHPSPVAYPIFVLRSRSIGCAAKNPDLG